MAALTLVLVGCSSGDRATPSNDGASAGTGAAAAEGGASRPYPNLASVPPRPTPSTSAEERQRIAQGLAADRGSARYSDEPLRPVNESADAILGERLGGAARTEPAAPGAAPAASPAGPDMTATAGGPITDPVPPRAPVEATQLPAAPPAPPAPPPIEAARPVPPQAPAAVPATPPTPAPPPPAPEAQMPATPPASPSPASPPDVAAVPQPAPAPGGAQPDIRSPIVTQPGTRGGTLQVARIQFQRGSAEIDRIGRDVLRQVADIQKKQGGTLRIVGHASEDVAPNTTRTNYDVSMARAGAVAEALTSLGVPQSAIKVEAAGDEKPEYAPSGTGIAANRRAEIYLDF